MRVLALGAGVIGVACAYYLRRAGAEVIALDRREGPGLETSFANAGQVSPGYSAPWAAPGMPAKAARWIFQRHSPLALRPDGTLWQLRWAARLLGECGAGRYARNKERMVRLAEYSRDCLKSLRGELGLEYSQRELGTLQIFRTGEQLEAAGKDVEVLRGCAVAHELLDRAGCERAEPALRWAAAPIAGGLRLPGDETGDCREFVVGLEREARALGARFRYGARVEGLAIERGRFRGVRLEGGEEIEADAAVVALGSYSRGLLEALGIEIPVYPVKGYSLTIPIGREEGAPVSTVMDEAHKVAITRLGSRMRLGGMAELCGFDLSLNPRRRATLEKVARELFPQAGDPGAGELWAGLRPMTPDGTPLIGEAGPEGLWVCSGHGTLGWTMACGSARILADRMLGRAPEIEAGDFGLGRYGGRR